MSDSLLETYYRYGTDADRLAFTPDPPVVSGSAVTVIYLWYVSSGSGTGNVYLYDTAWHLIASSSSGSAITALTGDVTATGPGSVAATIAAGAVTLAKIVNAAANSKLLGSGSAGAGSSYSELTIGTGLSMSGTTLSASSSLATRAITFAIDGGGSALTTGVKADVYVPYACTITAVTMLADQSGSVVVDIWKDTYANYPPTVADTITASAKPTITTATNSQDTTLTGWTTSISAGDSLRFNIDSASTITRLVLTLTVTA